MTNCCLGTRANQSKLKREPQIQCLSFFPEEKLRPSEVGPGRPGGGGGGGVGWITPNHTITHIS